ncbi:MAG: ferritin [Candidatus Eisenbacteria bacterium]|nr:ferritin [Candidatus Eisenbacteria bacterium]
MLKKKVEKALNEQLNAEMYSAYLYLSMASYFDDEGLDGFANWMRIQFQEEQAHALKIYDFVNERGGRVRLKPIDGPDTDWKSPQDVFEQTLKHEQLVTSLINKLVDLARAESDHATDNFLQWFVAEQVEEEATAESILSKVKRVGDKGNGIYMLDKELGSRVFTPPAEEE